MSKLFRGLIMLMIGMAIFVGLPVVGWGVKEVGRFMNHPARLGYVILVFVLQVMVIIKMPGLGQNRSKGTQLVKRQQLVVVLLQWLSMAVMVLAPYSDARGVGVWFGNAGIRYLGLVLFAVGFFIMHWAEAHLGKLFSVEVTIQEGHRLVTDGPYQYCRHPRYLGILLFSLGISLVFASWWALILVVALVLVLMWRIHDEEILLHHQFGAEWEEYVERTWGLLPLFP